MASFSADVTTGNLLRELNSDEVELVHGGGFFGALIGGAIGFVVAKLTHSNDTLGAEALGATIGALLPI